MQCVCVCMSVRVFAFDLYQLCPVIVVISLPIVGGVCRAA